MMRVRDAGLEPERRQGKSALAEMTDYPCSGAPLKLTFVRELRLAAEVGGEDYFHAASGLALCSGILHVVADDSNVLASFALAGGRGEVMPLLTRPRLPADPVARKRAKPDFEALVQLSPEEGLPHGGLLALGSGSTPARTAGAIVTLDKGGRAVSSIEVDLEATLYAGLRGVFPEVNIEGGVWRDGRLLLFQRGNASERNSTIVTFEAPHPAAALRDGRSFGPPHYHRLDLGSIEGVPLAFTDATLLDDMILFAATAEQTYNAYDDGEVLGSVVGILSPTMEVAGCWRLDPPLKFEGIVAKRSRRGIDLLLVSDADDPAVPSMLFAGRIEGTPPERDEPFE